jgi:hypothetical protein
MKECSNMLSYLATFGFRKKTFHILSAVALLAVTACSTNRTNSARNLPAKNSIAEVTPAESFPDAVAARVPEVTPVGTFLGPVTEHRMYEKFFNPRRPFINVTSKAVGQPFIKLTLEADGNYVAEDVGPTEYWIMMEGNRSYPQRIVKTPETGHWVWETNTGKVLLTTNKRGDFRWSVGEFSFDKEHPRQLSHGKYAYLERAEEE